MKTIKETILGGPSASCSVQGWVRTHRQSKNVSFIELNDGSTQASLQLVIDPSLTGYPEIAQSITTGSSISAEGELVTSQGKGQNLELQVKKITLIGTSDAETYPLQKKGHTLEFLREQLHLRPRTNTIGASLRIRSTVSYLIHQFFQEQGFFYLHAPIITTSDCEGAGEMFRITSLDLAKVPLVDGKVDYTQDFFKESAHLSVSGQLSGEVGACALGRVYTFAPIFRAENSNTVRHLSEFWMIEPEMAFAELQDNMKLAEDFIRFLTKETLARCEQDLTFLHAREWAPKDLRDSLELILTKPFATIEYTDAIKILEQSGRTFEFPVRWGMNLQAEHEKFLTDEYVKGPAIVVNYPKEIKSFYMRLNEDGKTVRAMDVLLPRLGEVIGGSQREERADVLEQKIKDSNLPLENYWWYLELRRYGTVPHSGFGFGLERFLMYVTGIQNIRDVTPFPRFPGFARF